MTKYRVHMQAFIDMTVDVEAEDYETAIERAYEDMPSSIGAVESGWGQDWSKEEGEYEPYEVTEEVTGKTVWTAGGQWQRVYPKATDTAAGGAP